MAKPLEPRLNTAWDGRTGKHKHRAFSSRLQSLLAATCSLEEKMLLLWYWLRSRLKSQQSFNALQFRPQQVTFLFMWNENFDGVGERLLPTKAAPIASLNLSISRCLWLKIWHRNKTSCSESNPVQSSRSISTTNRTCPRKGVSAQIWIEQHTEHRDFRWQHAIAWKQCQAWFWHDSNQSLQPNLSQMKCYFSKPLSDQRWQDKLWFSIWRFFGQSASVNNHLLCYWPTIHN